MARHHQVGVGEQGQRDVPVPGVPLPDLVLVEPDHLLRVLTERLAGIDGIRSTETLVELRFVKESYQWGAR